MDQTGKERKIYRYERMMTPYEKLKSLPGAKHYLNPEVTFEIPDIKAYQFSDNQAADRLQKARQQLFTTIHERTHSTG